MRHQVLPWRARVTIVSLGLVAALVVQAAPAHADKISDKKAQAQQVAQRLDQLGNRVEQLAERYNAARLAANNVQSDVAKAAAGVARANDELHQQRTVLRDVALQSYVGGAGPGQLDMTSGATDVAVQRTYVESLVGRQQDTLDGLRQAKLDLTVQQQHLAAAQSQAKSALAAVSRDSQAAAAAESQQEAELAKVKGELATLVAAEQARQAAIEAEKARQQMLRQQAQAASRARAVAAARSALASVPSPSLGGSGPAPAGHPVAAGRGAAAAIAEAQRQLGKPYRWGAAGPDSFDCSGLTMWAWAAAGVSLPHNTTAQYNATTHVPLSDIQPGDLLFYGSDLHHVGLYVGNGTMIEAPHSGTNVRYASIYRSDFAVASRPSA